MTESERESAVALIEQAKDELGLARACVGKTAMAGSLEEIREKLTSLQREIQMVEKDAE